MKPTIDELAVKWRTDKTPSIQHAYTPFYQTLFGDKQVKKLLEIGIGFPGTMPHVQDYIAGASLFMWEEYFEDAEIYAADIRPELLINRGRIHSVVADQSNEQSLRGIEEAFGRDFDVIIEDGSHDSNHQILAAKILVPLLVPGGIYVIEDVEQPAQIAGSLPWRCELHEFNTAQFCNDRLIVIRRPT